MAEPNPAPATTTAAPADAATAKWTSREVADYLARWGVEEAVQQAVNSAIKHKAADPVLHIANMLEEKGRELEATHAAQPTSD